MYSDTRSQMYRGVAAETAVTNGAIAATAGQIVTYGGQPAITYYFASSGGHTEDVQDAFGGAAEPWLVGVADPYDQGPLHSWTLSMSFASAAARLRGLLKGSFRGIEVLERGVSPRILSAEVLGSGGDTQVSGPELEGRLGLYSTWAYFSVKNGTTVTREPDRSGQPPASGPAPAGGAPPVPASPEGGVQGPAGSPGSTPAGGDAAPATAASTTSTAGTGGVSAG